MISPIFTIWNEHAGAPASSDSGFGGGLIGCAKFPVYRSGRFFTFGAKSIPEHLAGYYSWGWRVFLFGAVEWCDQRECRQLYRRG
jgi:hypothetical protein